MSCSQVKKEVLHCNNIVINLVFVFPYIYKRLFVYLYSFKRITNKFQLRHCRT